MKKEIYAAANFRAAVTVIAVGAAIAIMIKKYTK